MGKDSRTSSCNPIGRRLQHGRIRLGNFSGLPLRCPLQRLDGASFVVMQNDIELLRELRVEIVARALRSRQIDDANGTLQERLLQGRCSLFPLTETKEKIRSTHLVEERLVTPGQRGPDILTFSRTIPTGRRRHGARVRSKPNEGRFSAVSLAYQLAQIQFPSLSHFCRAGVPEMRVMRPDNNLRSRSKVVPQRIQGLRHMGVTQIPRGDSFMK